MKYDLENINARFGIGSQKWQEMKNNPLVDEKVIPFSVADMEFKLAPEITEGLKKFIDDNILGYAGTNKKYRDMQARIKNIVKTFVNGNKNIMILQLMKNGL